MLFTLCLFASGNSTVPENVSQKRVVQSLLSYGRQILDHAALKGDPRMKILQEKWEGPLEVPKLIANIVKEDTVLFNCLISVKLIQSVS